MRLYPQFVFAASLLAAGSLFAADATTAAPQHKVAIIVENRAGAQLNEKVAVFEDLLSSRIAGKGYSVISRDVTLNALKTYSNIGVATSSHSTMHANALNASHSHSSSADSLHEELAQNTKLHVKTEATPGLDSSTVVTNGSAPDTTQSTPDQTQNAPDQTQTTADQTQGPDQTQSAPDATQSSPDTSGNGTVTTVSAPGTNAATYEASQLASSRYQARQTNVSREFGHGSASMEVAQADSSKFAATPDTTRLDQALSDNTSALRLAQNLGADFILMPSLATYGTERKAYSGEGFHTINVVYTLRVSCKIVEAGAGGAIKGDVVTATKTIRQTGDLQVDSSDVINELLDDAAGQLADLLVRAAGSFSAEVAKSKQVDFSIACSMTDVKEQPITVPNVQVTADKRVVKTNAPIEVQPLDVTVELDGIAIGSAPGTFQAYPGLHKLRLSREGFKDWERTVNIYDNQKLRVALQMSDEGFARWQENLAFLQSLQDDRKLTDAEVKRIEGVAKFFSESHYRVDTKENVKIYKSLY